MLQAANCFRLPTLCVHIADPEAELEANSLLHPAGHQPRVSRMVFHETVHYWQYHVSGFIARLADEELERLRNYEAGEPPAPPGSIHQEYRKHYECVGFSAHDLLESLARYWDVHVLGPILLLQLDLSDAKRRIPEAFQERYAKLEADNLLQMPDGSYTDLAYDLAMEASGGNYGKPYLSVRDQYPPAFAAGLFPIIGGVALMAERPVPFFVRLLRMVESRLDNIVAGDIHQIWQSSYFPIQGFARQLAEELGEDFASSTIVYQERDLDKHIPHHFAAYERMNAIHALAESDVVKDMAAEKNIDVQTLALFELERRLLVPGDPEHRAFLSYYLSPPCVDHAGGDRWLPGETMRRQLCPDINEAERRVLASRNEVADEVIDLDRRWQCFIRASIKTHFQMAKQAMQDLPEDHAFYSAVQSLIRSANSKYTDYKELFSSMLHEYPGPCPEVMSFWGRHVLLGSIQSKEIREVNAMICMQLATKTGLNNYDARTGLLWEWDGQPVEMALAAELGRLTAMHLDMDELSDECSAVFLRSLDAFYEVIKDRGVEAITDTVNRLRTLLHAELGQQEALTHIDAMIDQYRREL